MKKFAFLVVACALIIPAVSFTGGSPSQPAVARFTGVFSDSGVDDNGDGLYEGLMVMAEVEVDSAGSYIMGGYLTDDSGREITRSSHGWPTAFGNFIGVDCDSGVNTFAMRFSGEHIWRSKADGVYRAVLSLRVGDRNVDIRVPCSSYVHTQFRETVAEMIGPVSHRGVDTTGDGVYDYLEVLVEFEIISPGVYWADARLTYEIKGGGPGWEFIDDDRVTDTLPSGRDTVEFIFDVEPGETAGGEELWTLRVRLDSHSFRCNLDSSFDLTGYQRSDFGQ